MRTTTIGPVRIGHTKDEAAVRRIETAARVRVTMTHDLRNRAYLVTTATQADAQAFLAMAEHLGLSVCY